MPSNLQIIADRLNISTATVSRALNGKSGVSSKVRKNVLDVAQELNMFTRPVAQNLDSDHAMAIAFVLRRGPTPMVEDTFYNSMMKGAELELSQQGYHLVSISLEENPLFGAQFPPNLDARRLDGLIVVGPELSQHTMAKLKSLEIPIVLCANHDLAMEIDGVTSANREGAQLAVEHLVAHGHRHIVCITGPADWQPVRDRVEGYLDVMRAHGFEPHVLSLDGYLTADTGYTLGQRALQEFPETTAIVAGNDPMALGAIRAIKDMGKSIPQDVAIVGYDNVYWTDSIDPSLTTVFIHKETIGMLAAQRLLELIQKGPQVPISIRVKNELVIRESCGCTSHGG